MSPVHARTWPRQTRSPSLGLGHGFGTASSIKHDPYVPVAVGAGSAGPLRDSGSGYGVDGSANEPPKMSELPNVTGQSIPGDGLAIGLPLTSDCRYASIAGQSPALRTSL